MSDLSVQEPELFAEAMAGVRHRSPEVNVVTESNDINDGRVAGMPAAFESLVIRELCRFSRDAMRAFAYSRTPQPLAVRGTTQRRQALARDRLVSLSRGS